MLGEVRGYGSTSDAYHLTAPEPEGAAPPTAIARRAAPTPASTPEDVDYVNAHGTSTPLNDRAETHAMKLALGERAHDGPGVLDRSRRSATCSARPARSRRSRRVLALRDRVAPPTLGYEQPDEGLDLDYVPAPRGRSTPTARAPVALSNSFGFGGHNVVLCLEAA